LTGNQQLPRDTLKPPSSPYRYFQDRWEILFFVVVVVLLSVQIFSFYFDVQSLSDLRGVTAFFVGFVSFVATRLAYVSLPLTLFPLAYLLCCWKRPAWARPYLDFLGAYVIFRLVIQLIGLNILVFDSVTSRFLLISQVLFFLPYSLLIWGWIYWRLDTIARARNRPFFRLDCESVAPPRPIDYFVASFSSVFSATINAIKGNSARARMLILFHGFMIYDVMGITLSRAVALIQTNK
jgi:hypothetical protein